MAEAIVASCGIYTITHSVRGKAYVGSARNIQRRWKRHITDLNCGRHHSVKLQRAWSKYGQSAFRLEVVEVVADESHLVEREQHWIDSLDAFHGGFNASQKAANCLGVKHSHETRKKVAAKAREAWADPDVRQRMIAARTGRVFTEETRAKIAAAQTGKKRQKQSAETLAKRAKTVRERLDAGLITMRADVTTERLAAMNLASRTPEAIEKRRRALAGKKQPREVVEKRAEALRERYRNDPELLARISQSQKGVPKSRESIEKMIATRAANKAAKLASIQIALPEID